MPYDITLVQVSDRPHGGCAITVPFPNLYNGFPTIPFDYLLANMWVCLPGGGGAGSGTGPSFSFFSIDAVSATNEIEVQLYDSTGAIIYDATYSASIRGVRSNIILSVDSVAKIVQIYLNDAPLSVISGTGWTGSGPFSIVNTSSRQNLWDFEYDGIFFDPAAADMWFAAPASFFDLTITSNRRKFINADLTPVYLGANGSNPLGTQPPVFLTVPSGGVPSDIRNNYGTGGAFSTSIGVPIITFEAPGTCTLPPPPKQVTLAEFWFGQTSGFVDPSAVPNRRKFIAAAGGAQNLGMDGALPFGFSPVVFLTRTAAPTTFALNNGRGGVFQNGGDLSAGATDPPGSTASVAAGFTHPPGNGSVGDYRNGNLYAFNPEVNQDSGQQRKWVRRWLALPGSTIQATRYSYLAIDMQTGIRVPPDTNPQVMLRWSDDGGHSWSNYRLLAVGRSGQTAFTVKANRLGSTKRFNRADRIFEISSTDPFQVAIVDAEVDAS